MESLRLTVTLPADPDTVYDAWISAKVHAAMTGGAATSEAKKGGVFTACDNYISGKHLALEPGKRILQSWRTTEFPTSAPDSRLELRLSVLDGGTRLLLLQSDIPDGQSEMYAQGWQDSYFEPMTRYFVMVKDAPKQKPAKKKKAAKKAPAKAAAKASAKKAPAKAAAKKAVPKVTKKAVAKKAPKKPAKKKTKR